MRDEELLSLEDAHWRLSALPARCAGFVDRGVLDVGMAADVIVYDLDKLAVGPVERVTDLPGGEWRRVQRGLGYSYVIVNGKAPWWMAGKPKRAQACSFAVDGLLLTTSVLPGGPACVRRNASC